jgi:hypothetical protein
MQKNIKPFWDKFYQTLDFETSLFRDPEQVSEWESAGHHLPSTTIDIHQVPDPTTNFNEFIKHFDLKHIGVCIHRLTPGHYLPTHVDRYKFFKTKFNITDDNSIHRYVVFLEDWKDGHLLTVNGTVYTHWKAGDCIGWQGCTPHSAINLGVENRYTLQITGCV